MFDPTPSHLYQQMLDHLTWIASFGWDGAKHYAWTRAKELEAHPLRMWVGIKDDLARRMQSPSRGPQP